MEIGEVTEWHCKKNDARLKYKVGGERNTALKREMLGVDAEKQRGVVDYLLLTSSLLWRGGAIQPTRNFETYHR